MRQAVVLAVIACASAAGAAACSSQNRGGPEIRPALAGSRSAQLEFRALQQRWLSDKHRAALERAFEDFVRRYPDDARTRWARIYLAFLHAEAGRLELARATVAPTRQGPAGAAHDFADVVEASILVREGQAARAVLLLQPLSGKIVDPEERLIFGEQLVVATLAARQWPTAASAMVDWIADAAPDQLEDVRGALRNRVMVLPSRALERVLHSLQIAGVEARTRAPAREWLRKLLRDRLTQLALTESDAELARRLLDSAPPSLRGSEQGRALSRIATEGTVTARVIGRSIGLVLSLGDERTRRRSAEVTAGVSRALGLPTSAKDPNSVRLLIEEEHGQPGHMQRALAALSGEGAAVLVAGVDAAGASEAANYALRAKIPVIVLAPPEPKPQASVFCVAPPADSDRAALDGAVNGSAQTPAIVIGAEGLPCRAEVPAGETRFPVAEWRKSKTRALMVVEDAECGRELFAELERARLRPLVGLGLESAELLPLADYRGQKIAVSAGRFPGSATTENSSNLRWYEVLGHDAGVLAGAAVRDFPLQQAEQAGEVARLHERARRALLEVRAELWSTEQKGFANAHELGRTLRVVGGENDPYTEDR